MQSNEIIQFLKQFNLTMQDFLDAKEYFTKSKFNKYGNAPKKIKKISDKICSIERAYQYPRHPLNTQAAAFFMYNPELLFEAQLKMPNTREIRIKKRASRSEWMLKINALS